MINKDRAFFQYNSRDLVCIISLLTSQLCTASWKVTIKYIGPIVIYKIIDPHNYLLMILDGRILRGLFEHERLKHANIRTSQGNVQNLGGLIYRSYNLLNKKIFSNPFNWSADVACLMLWGSPFHILGLIDENEEF